MKHVDEALRALDGKGNGEDPQSAVQLARALRKVARDRLRREQRKRQHSGDAGDDGDEFIERLEAREGLHGTLQQGPSGKLLEQWAPPPAQPKPPAPPPPQPEPQRPPQQPPPPDSVLALAQAGHGSEAQRNTAGSDASIESSESSHWLARPKVIPQQRARTPPKEDRAVKPGRFSRTVVRYPCCVALTTAIVALAASFLAVRMEPRMPELVQRSGWSQDSSSIIMANLALGVLRGDALQPASVGNPEGAAGPARPLSSSLPNSETTILYNAHSGATVLTADGVGSMAAFERQVLEMEEYATHYCLRAYSTTNPDQFGCRSPQSLLPLLYLNATAHESQCLDGFCAAPSQLSLCTSGTVEWGAPPCVSTIYDWRSGTLAPESDWPSLLRERLCGPFPQRRNILLAADATCTSSEFDTASVQYARTVFSVGSPLLNFTGETDGGLGNATDLDSQWNALSESRFASELKTALRAAQDDLSATSSGARTYSSSPAEGKPLAITWTNAATGALNDLILVDLMLATASVAFVFLYVTFNLRSLFLACCGMFEIIVSLPLAYFVWKVLMRQTRISWLQVLSVYIVLCVGADDLFVFHDTWRMSKEKSSAISGSLETRFAWTFKRAALAMLSTTATTAICLIATAASPMGQMKAFGIFTALAIVADYLLVITFFAACTVAHAKYIVPPWQRCFHRCTVTSESFSESFRHAAHMKPKTYEHDLDGAYEGHWHEEEHHQNERPATRFLRLRCAPAIQRWRWALLCASTTLCVGSAISVYLAMRPAEELKFFSPDHPWQRTIGINAEEFLGLTDWKHPVTLAYGLGSPQLEYRQTVEFLRPDYSTERPWSAVYQDSWEFDAAVQARIAADCDAAAVATALVSTGEVYCVLNVLRDSNATAFPYATSAELHDALVALYASDGYAALVANISDFPAQTGFVSSSNGAAGGHVVALWHAFNSTIPQTTRPTPGSAGPHWEAWDSFARARCVDLGCVQTTQLWRFFDVLRSLFTFALSTTIICVGCSFVVLLIATSNVLIALYATLTIVAIILSVLAGVLLLGFSFGMFECIFIILTCGMAIDYAVHLAHFYTHASGGRVRRTTSALHGVGLSILGGAATTMGAGAPQFACAILFFQLNGIFIFLTSGLSLFFSFSMLLPLLMMAGPEGDQGELAALWRRACRSCKARAGNTRDNVTL
jgi:hypothetical protein